MMKDKNLLSRRVAYVAIYVVAALFCVLNEYGVWQLSEGPFSTGGTYALDLACILTGVGFTWLALRRCRVVTAKHRLSWGGWLPLVLACVAIWFNAAAYYVDAFHRTSGLCLLIAAIGCLFLWPMSAKPSASEGNEPSSAAPRDKD